MIMSTLLFLHFAGIIIALGAVTVIDTMGFISRRSTTWTDITIKAHHVTKPLIWIGTILMAASWMFIFDGSLMHLLKTVLIIILVANGTFLSLSISPELDKHPQKKLLPSTLQVKIAVSMVVSFISWWTLVALTVS